MAWPDDLIDIRDNLVAELKGETARRAALVAAGHPPPVTYSSGGKSVSWSQYCKDKLAEIRDANELAMAAGAEGIPEATLHMVL